MPHSSGGGSHGGGSHGGSHGGSGGPRISRSYFAGARRYRKHNTSTGEDEYIYASSKPSKTGLFSTIFIAVFAAVFLGGMGAGLYSELPHKLKAHYLDVPAVHDDINVIDDEEQLTKSLIDFQELTGICPVIYTAYIDDWTDDYVNLESYTFNVYTSNFSDEDHFVIVYSITKADKARLENGETDVPDYYWEAVQGDNTDPILTESVFKKFADKVQEGLERGSDPGDAFNRAFKDLYGRLENRFTPGSPAYLFNLAGGIAPLLFVASVFGLFLFLNIRQYRKEKDVEYEEVPLDVEPQAPQPAATSGVYGNYRYKQVYYDASSGQKAPLAAKIILYAVTIPFILIGLFMTLIGFLMLNVSGNRDGRFVIGFGIMWTAISAFVLIKMTITFIKTDRKAKKDDDDNKDDNEDEDYKRMKRQGFE